MHGPGLTKFFTVQGKFGEHGGPSTFDNETITLLGYVFAPTETASRNPITTHWTIDWDVAAIIEALEELYPLQA